MKKQVIYCPKCKKHVELIREVLRTPNGTFDKVVSLCAKCGEALAIIAVKYLPEGDLLKEVLCEEKQSKPAPKGNIQKLTVKEVIKIELITGIGIDPYRRIEQYWTLDGVIFSGNRYGGINEIQKKTNSN